MSDAPDLDAVIARVRAEAERPEYQVPEAGNLQSRAASADSGTGVKGGPAPHRPTAASVGSGTGAPRGPAPRTLEEFLVIGDDTRFIEAAYACLLGREADPIGLRDYGSRLEAGYGRPFVLAALAAAPEAGARSRRVQRPWAGTAVLQCVAAEPSHRAGNGWATDLTGPMRAGGNGASWLIPSGCPPSIADKRCSRSSLALWNNIG